MQQEDQQDGPVGKNACCQARGHPQDPHGRRSKPASTSLYTLTMTHVCMRVHTDTHANTNTLNKNYKKDFFKSTRVDSSLGSR